MGKVVDLLYEAFVKIEDDGSLILDHEFMMNIFSPLYEQLPELLVRGENIFIINP